MTKWIDWMGDYPEPEDPDWWRKFTRIDEAVDMLKERRGDQPWSDILVGHIDTGIRNIAAFGPWVDIAAGMDLIQPGQPPIDPMAPNGFAGHGTKTLSVLAGSNIGLIPGVPVVPFRAVEDVMLGTKIEAMRVGQAINAAVDMGCDVITISLGYPLARSSAMGEAVDRAWKRGVIVCGAGGQVVDKTCYPGKFSRAIGVGGIKLLGAQPDRRGIYWDYVRSAANIVDMPVTSMRSYIDVWAPAQPIPRLEPIVSQTPGTQTQAVMGFGDGTSYATPHVAAAAAIWLAYHGDRLRMYRPHQMVEAFRLLLKTTAQDISGDKGFAGMHPATEASCVRKGGGPRGIGTSGGLDVAALLEAPLPAPDEIPSEDREAVAEWA